MNNFTGRRGLHLLLGASLMVAASVSHAQYVWVNDKGVRQISDKAPPASVPLKNILRAPGGVPAAAPPPAAPTAPAQSGPASAPTSAAKDSAPTTTAEQAAAAAKARMTPDQVRLAEREADYQKRQKEAAEEAAKEKAERVQKALKKASCDSAKQYKATLDTKQPVTTVSPSGEVVFMEDDQRKKLGDQAQKVLNDCKR